MKKHLLSLIAMLLLISACADMSRKEAASIAADYESEITTEEASPLLLLPKTGLPVKQWSNVRLKP